MPIAATSKKNLKNKKTKKGVKIEKKGQKYILKLKDIEEFRKLTDDEKLLNFEIKICGCGISKKMPFCDGSHHKSLFGPDKK